MIRVSLEPIREANVKGTDPFCSEYVAKCVSPRRFSARLFAQGGLARGALVLSGLMVGCSATPPEAAKSPSARSPAAVKLADREKPDEAEGIQLKVASWEETQATVASQRGSIVVLDLWSTYCPPCLAELPHLAALHERYGSDVVCLSLNCNFAGDGSPEEERAAIMAVLSEKKARFLNLISSDADQVLYKKVGIASIPVVQVYDRSGKLRKQFDNEKGEYGKEGFTYTRHIVPFVEQLLKETKP